MTEERIISYSDLLQRRDIQFPFHVRFCQATCVTFPLFFYI